MHHDLITLRDFEEAARERLDPVYFDYVSGGARDEVTLRANETGFARLSLLPRMLRGNEKRPLEITLLNSRASMPVVLSPTAFHKLMTPEGERATARDRRGRRHPDHQHGGDRRGRGRDRGVPRGGGRRGP